MSRRRYELTDFEWSVIAPLLPNKSRGVARVDDRRVLNGILWRFRSGAPWADIPERYGPYTTCYNRFVRWRKAGVWDKLFDAVSKAYDTDALRDMLENKDGFRKYPAQVKQKAEFLFQQMALQATQSGRTLLFKTQTIWCDCNTLRQK